MIENFKKEVIRYEQAEQKPEPVYRESEAEQRAEQESADRHPEQEERPSVLSAVCPVESVPWQAFHRDGMREGLSEPGSESPFPFLRARGGLILPSAALRRTGIARSPAHCGRNTR